MGDTAVTALHTFGFLEDVWIQLEKLEEYLCCFNRTEQHSTSLEGAVELLGFEARGLMIAPIRLWDINQAIHIKFD